MSAALSVTLPYPPSSNRLWRSVSGRVVRSEEYRAWLNEASWLVSAAVKALPDRRGVPGPYALTVRVCSPDRRARDLDNTIKALSDALKHGGAVVDDRLCQRIEAEWDPEISGAFVCVMETKPRIPPPVKAPRRRK